MSIIKVKNLTKKFDKKIAVDNLSFEVEENQIFGLLGTNGAGKSTIINILTGLLLPDSGKIKILDYDIKSIEKIRKNIALVPQSISLYEDLTIYENIEFFAGMYITDNKKLNESIEKTTQQLKIKNLLHKQVGNLSGGYKRITSIACALAINPKILFFDEPLTGIDIHTNQMILQMLQQLRKKMTIIFTTHSIKEAENLCDYVFFIDKGKCFLQGKTNNIIQNFVKQYGQNIIIKFDNPKDTHKIEKYFKKSNLSISKMKYSGKNLQLNVLDPNFGIKDIFNLSKKTSIDVCDIQIKQPNLESVFNKVYKK